MIISNHGTGLDPGGAAEAAIPALPAQAPEGRVKLEATMTKIYNRRKRITPRPIGARLFKIRNYFGYSQIQMAKQLELSRGGYGNNEKGKSLIDLNTAVTVRNKLGVSLEWLLFDNGPMFLPKEEEKKTAAPEHKIDREAGVMLKLMNQIPFIRHAVIGFFQKFQVDNEETIRKIQETEKNG